MGHLVVQYGAPQCHGQARGHAPDIDHGKQQPQWRYHSYQRHQTAAHKKANHHKSPGAAKGFNCVHYSKVGADNTQAKNHLQHCVETGTAIVKLAGNQRHAHQVDTKGQKAGGKDNK